MWGGGSGTADAEGTTGGIIGGGPTGGGPTKGTWGGTIGGAKGTWGGSTGGAGTADDDDKVPIIGCGVAGTADDDDKVPIIGIAGGIGGNGWGCG